METCQLDFTKYKMKLMLNVVNILSMAVESLSEYVSRIIREKELSYRQIEAKSGGTITGSYVNQIANGEILPEKISVGKIKSLAKGLGEPEENVFAVIRGTKPNSKFANKEKFENLALKFSGVSPSKQDRAEALYELMDREIDRLINEK